MSDQSSVTDWIIQLKKGEHAPVDKLWQRYFNRMVALGDRSLFASPRQAADEEDIALSAFKSFCLRVADSGFARLNDRNDLWKLLATITIRKAAKHRRRESLRQSVSIADIAEISDITAPDCLTILEDQTQQLIAKLGDPVLQVVAKQRLAGLSNREIALRIGKSVPTVERKLRLIREMWSQEDFFNG